MNRADRMLEVLRDGRPHSRREIFDRAGFMLTNNAASELRARGLDVRQWREDGVYVYKLLSEAESVRAEKLRAVDEGGSSFPAPSGSVASASLSEPVQLALVPPDNGAYRREAA